MTVQTPRDPFANDIATAPGDLPMPEIAARAAAQRTQFRHDNTLAPLAPCADEPVEVWATSGDDMRLERAAVFYTLDGSLPDPSSAVAAPMVMVTVDWDLHANFLTRWRATIPPQSEGMMVRYRIGGWHGGAPVSQVAPDVWAHDGQGFWFRQPGERGITTFAYHVEPPGLNLPAWIRDAVIYHIFLDRFHPGTPGGRFPAHADPQGIHGGTLRGVRQALPYLEELGVTCLWLSPFCASPSYHRYDATDYHTVDPALGTNEDLRALTGAAHDRGMRVMMDFVPGHCSWRHPAFVAAQQDRSAPTASWFTFDEWPDRYRTFLGLAPFLPSFNTDDPGARAYLIGSAVQWLREYGIDAFRLDHAIGPSMDFWVAFRTATRAAAPDVFSVGEVTDTPDSLRRYRRRLDAVLDFPLARALRSTFGLGDWGVARFDNVLRAYDEYMATGPATVSFLDNHDMDRFRFVAGGDVERLKLAALCQFTLAPTPIIYYGTEIGLSQQQGMAATGFGGDQEVRRDMPWDERQWDQDLLTFYRALIRLRRDHPVLRDGTRRTLHVDDMAGTYAYLRSRAAGPDLSPGDLLVLFNTGTTEKTVALRAAPVGGHEYTCILCSAVTPDVRPVDATAVAITLAPRTGTVLVVTSARER